MTLNSHEQQDILWEVFHQCKNGADEENLVKKLEEQTTLKFSDYFKDRRSAARLREGVVNWVLVNYRDLGDQSRIDLIESELGSEKVVLATGGAVYTYLLQQIFGKKQFIEAMNAIGQAGLRDDFFGERESISDRDFSFVLDEE